MTETTGTPGTAHKTREGTRRGLDAADAARVATFAALIAVLGLPGTLSLFGNAVPITLQTLGVMLAGAVLGARRGALAVLTLLALVAAGLPLLAGGRGGLGVFVLPSAGYLMGFVAGAWVVGMMVGRLRKVTFGGVLVAALVGGVAAIYAFGIPVHALVTGIPLPQAAWLSLGFLPGDVLKALACAGITVAVARAYPAALRHRTQEG
ncbi:biotin transporter BioY [Isoptericola croceus]|uniref:biotin transporter BioY n=1 Tax=Isoptericola croceus TaxID=3031406 RepID=UPI0023FA114A|nr:biotin transporter BioY [Isoptericola croceus]